jgi:uncharacterized LabA/DUF88 family protein
MARIAVLIDLSFFVARYKKLKLSPGAIPIAADAAKCVWDSAKAHVVNGEDELYRILVYDCRPLAKKAHNPISKSAIDFATSHVFKFRTELHRQLVCKRKVALRLGELADRARWIIRENPTKDLLKGTKAIADLKPDDVEYDVQQKGVDIKIGIDIASIAYKRLADRIVLITGDSDFVPAAKLARREGIDLVLDPLWATISPSLNEHVDGLNTNWPKPRPAA